MSPGRIASHPYDIEAVFRAGPEYTSPGLAVNTPLQELVSKRLVLLRLDPLHSRLMDDLGARLRGSLIHRGALVDLRDQGVRASLQRLTTCS